MSLGSSSGRPTATRNLSSTLVDHVNETIMVDCGEGTQFQLLKSPASERRISTICITHLHGDHMLGLPGLLSTMSMNERTAPLTIVGPTGLAAFLEFIASTPFGRLGFELRHVEIDPQSLVPGKVETVDIPSRFIVQVAPLDHRIPCIGYRISERPRRPPFDADRAHDVGISGHQFARLEREGTIRTDRGLVRLEDVTKPPAEPLAVCVLGDTRPCDSSIALAERVDLLQHEATYLDKHAALAEKYGHSTATQAATIARDAAVRHLVITHFSSRYPDESVLVDEARQTFPSTTAADELAWVDVTKIQRGALSNRDS